MYTKSLCWASINILIKIHAKQDKNQISNWPCRLHTPEDSACRFVSKQGLQALTHVKSQKYNGKRGEFETATLNPHYSLCIIWAVLGSSDVIQFLAVNQNFLIFLFYLHVNATHNIKRYLFVNSDIVVKINGMLLCMYLFRWDFYGNLPCAKKQELVCMWGKK